MRVSDLLESDVDDEWITPLKDLSKHNYSGRAFVSGREADAALDAVSEGGDGDVLLWHSWESETVYEIHIASTTQAGVTRNLDAIKKAVPRAHLFTAYSRSGETITHMHWKDYAPR